MVLLRNSRASGSIATNETATSSVDIAATLGSAENWMCCISRSGSVSPRARNSDKATLSNEIRNAQTAPAVRPGAISGSVIRRKVR